MTIIPVTFFIGAILNRGEEAKDTFKKRFKSDTQANTSKQELNYQELLWVINIIIIIKIVSNQR